ncbi:hypothetical protein [Bacillus alkalicellulosilyticus]|uniref:hypothetical protein n=1 Tax=Alkalihalobacterium alkalicellulosilyticum TaxID=1912214 RepID=UPI0009970C0F|nr:hypothetical protein [Bacillus alkalicellulosilyticus]
MKQIPEFVRLNKYSDISFGLKEFLKGVISEEEYINKRKDDIGRVRYPWPELFFLKSDMKIYAEYLLKISLFGRRLLLLQEESIGFKKTELYDLYNISSDTIRRYLGKLKNNKRKEASPIIRNMTVKRPKVSKEVIAFFALLSRVPVSWLVDDEPEMEWRVDYFEYLPHAKTISLSQFKRILESSSLEILHDVTGVIINEGVKFPLYIRLESVCSGFIIEVFNLNFGLNDIVALRDLLKGFDYVEEGYMDTVIETHKNYVFIINSRGMKPICIPMEFHRHSYPTTL